MAGNSDDDENNSKLAADAPATTTTPAVVADADAAADAADDFIDDDSSDVEMEGKNYCCIYFNKKVNFYDVDMSAVIFLQSHTSLWIFILHAMRTCV